MFAEIAARLIPQCEIIDFAHDDKIDAPSGTARELAALEGARSRAHRGADRRIAGARGATISGSQIHSLRRPGFVRRVSTLLESTAAWTRCWICRDGPCGCTITNRPESISVPANDGFSTEDGLAKARCGQGADGDPTGPEPALVARFRHGHAGERSALPHPHGGRRLHPGVPRPGVGHLAHRRAGRARARSHRRAEGLSPHDRQ